MIDDFDTAKWRRENIFENEISPSQKILNEIEEIIAKYSDSINNSWGIPDDNFDNLAKDLHDYIYTNFLFKN